MSMQRNRLTACIAAAMIYGVKSDISQIFACWRRLGVLLPAVPTPAANDA